jgi:lysozyme
MTNIKTHSQSLIDLVKSSEGCELSAYKDTNGIPTIGYGATYYKDGSKVKIGDTITQEQAENLLNYHLTVYDKHVTDVVTSNINQNQYNALVDFCYNCGMGNLDSSTLLKKVDANPMDPTIVIEFNKWVYDQKKNKLPGLITRRAKEASLYFKPI